MEYLGSPISPALARRCLFVIGPAKSGTTVLLEAFNDSREIYLLNEPDLHHDQAGPGFATRFNAIYAAWASQLTKGRYCPDFFDGAGTWVDSVKRLAESHKLVGTKIVTRPFSSSDHIEAILRFHLLHFYDSHYVFSFRAPTEITASSYHFQNAFGGEISPIACVVRNFADTVGLFITMRRIFPNVRALFHENMGSATFSELGAELDVDLTRASTYYEARRIKDHQPLALSGEDANSVAAATVIYDDLVALVRDGMPQLQLAQTFLDTEAVIATRPGRLAQKCHQLGKALSQAVT